MIIVVGEVKFQPGELERLRGPLLKLVEASRTMPGRLHYSQSVDVADPEHLIVSQRWQDEEAMAGYYKSAELADFGKEVDETRIVALSIKAYTATFLRTMLGK